MNKKYKILFSLCAVFIFAFSMFLVNMQPLFAKADSISNYNVSFIAPDNSLLYYTGNYVPSGSSLQDLENNNLNNNISVIQDVNLTSSSSYSYVQGYAPSSDKNLILRGVATYTYINGFTFNMKSSSGMFFYRLYDKDSNIIDLSNKTVTYSFYVDGYFNSFTINLSSYSTSGNVWTSNIRNSNGVISQSRPRIYYNSTTHVWECGLDLWDNVDHEISKIKLEIGSIPTAYFSSQYIIDILSDYNFSNYYYQYDVDTSSAITSDKYYYPLKFTRQYDTWINKNWNGLNSFFGRSIWTDGTNYYYSSDYQQYVLDISTSTWILKDWNVLIKGQYVWTDGTNYYYSYNNSQYVLDTSTSTWTQKTWNLEELWGDKIWTDGTNYYYSEGSSTQYVLNISTSTWTQKTWNGYSAFSGDMIWSDGFNIYCSYGSNQYVLNTSTSTWTQKTWNGYSSFYGYHVWSDGVNYYLSNYNNQYVLNVTTSTWTQKVWNNLTSFSSTYIWKTPIGIFYSSGNQQYVLGSSLVPLDSDYYYDIGYSDGYDIGYTGGYDTGYNKGYNFGVDSAGNYTFFGLISSVIDAPIKVLTGLFNFEFLGVNLWSFFTGLFTLALIILIIKLALGGK